MIIKGRSPTMRHVSRTHRVALDWLFDRINLEPKIQFDCVDTKNQLADTLTKGSFSRDGWNQLLRLFSIVNFSMFLCSHFSDFLSNAIGKQSSMSKRGQEATSGEGSPMSKPRPKVLAKARPLNLVARSVWRWTKRSGNIWKQFANRFKVRSRIFSSESTRKCSNNRGKPVHGATPKRTWSESTFSLQKLRQPVQGATPRPEF